MAGSRNILKGVAAAAAVMCAGAGGAQLLPPLPPAVGDVVRGVGRTGIDAIERTTDEVGRLGASARELAERRLDRLQALVRAAPDILEMTNLGPAVRGEIIAVDADEGTIAAAREAGFVVVAEERIEGLGLGTVTLRPPPGLSLNRALGQLRRIAPEGEFSANLIHLQSGSPAIAGLAAAPASLAQGSGGSASAIGIIDGGVAGHPAISGPLEQRGFARGAPAPSPHGTAVASLAVGSGIVRGAAPRAPLLVADVYGRDPAGGNALAIARALGWMAERRVPVVAISLVGPPNPLLARSVEAARARGLHLVAAVGNDGPAAPPAYPASYPGVIAVTGADARGRPLPEAGRAAHLDYAAPGADMAAAAPGGRLVRVRGTSYAVPLVAGRMAVALGRGAAPIPALDAEAQDLGPRGPDRIYGRGLVCGSCRTPFSKK
jgi:hypothetical protein